MVSVLLGEFGNLSWRLLGTVALFVAFALMSWFDAEVSAKRDAWFGFASVGVSVYLFAAGIIKIWFPSASSTLTADVLAWLWLVVVARIALLHVHLLIHQQTKFTTPVMSIVTKVTFGLVVILAGMLSVPALLPDLEFEEIFWRVLFAVAILDVLGTVLIPLIYTLFHRPSRPVYPPAAYPAAPPVYPGAPAYPPASASPAPAYPSAPAHLQPVPPVMATPRETMTLAWPRYVNGEPVPSLPDGSPDLSPR